MVYFNLFKSKYRNGRNRVKVLNEKLHKLFLYFLREETNNNHNKTLSSKTSSLFIVFYS